MSTKKPSDKGGDNGPSKESEVAARLASIRNLPKTAETLGPDRFREEILPDLKDHMDDEDEVLLAMAEELGKPEHVDLFVGGSAHAHTLLVPLEILAKVEETAVREKAIASISAVASRIPEEHFEKYFVEMVHHLAESDWFSPKSSACGLFPVAYPRASPTWQLKLLTLFVTFCTDQTPMVRRNAASSLKHLAPLVDKAQFGQIVEAFKLLVPDDQDSVRLLAVENCVAIAGKLSEEDKNSIVKPVVLACGNDRSWRVRYMVANCFTQLVDSLGKNITQNDLVPVFVKLLKDSEAEVRTAASSKVSGVSKLLNRDTVVKDILPCVRLLSTDESAAVRAALASDVMGLAPLFGKEGTNMHLLDLFLQLLKDDTPEVRLNIIGKLNQVTQVLGLDQLSQHLLPAIVELAEDRQWRVRSAILEYIPLLAQQLGVEFFNEKLSSLCMSWLNDCVFSIREAATVNLKKLATFFGIPWTKQHIIPRVFEQLKHRNYLYRTTTLSMISVLAEVLPQSDVQQDLLPVLYILAIDPISNVRINAAKTFNTLIPGLDPVYVQNHVVPFITEKMFIDRDRDVLFFANVAIQNIKKK